MNKEEKSIFGRSPPPRASDVLFGDCKEDWKLNACIEHWGDVDWAYKIGFYDAAFQLTESMCQKPSDQDTMVYPILYLYRHHIEILLKSIVRLSVELLDEQVSGRMRKKLEQHDLQPLWCMIESKLNPICECAKSKPIPPEDIEGVRAYMQQLNDHDPKGVSFRYGRERDMSRTIRDDVVRINIRSFAICMEKLSNYLGGLENWLESLLELRRDIDAQ